MSIVRPRLNEEHAAGGPFGGAKLEHSYTLARASALAYNHETKRFRYNERKHIPLEVVVCAGGLENVFSILPRSYTRIRPVIEGYDHCPHLI